MEYQPQEWKNLPDKTAPITAERLNHIEDGIKNIDNRNIYSTNEKIVGYWINNKPIYRRVIKFTTGEHNIFKNISFDDMENVDEVVRLDGWFNRTDTAKYPLNHIRDNNTYAVLNFDSTVGIGSLVYQISGFYSNANAIVIIEYTKTTD